MVFAFPYALYPFLAESLDAPWALGLPYSAGAIGSLAATWTSGWTSHVRHHGRAVVVAAICWGLAVAGVGISANVWLVLVMLGLAGAADLVSGLFRVIVWNQTIPDEIRGRMAGIELLSYSIGPTLGQVRATGVARLTSLRTSFVSGGPAAQSSRSASLHRGSLSHSSERRCARSSAAAAASRLG